MNRVWNILLVTVLSLGLIGTTFAKESSSNLEGNLITSNSVGKVKLGMTVAQVREAVKPMTLHRTSDGEGIALIDIRNGSDDMLTIYAGEENPDAPISEDARVELIETRNADYQTSEGISPTMKLGELEKKYGKITQIMMSEIESREYAEFTNQPMGLRFRVSHRNGNAGRYEKGERTAKEYDSGAYVHSIIVLGGGSSVLTRIEVSSKTGIGIAKSFIKEKGDRVEYVVRAEKAHRMRVFIVDAETPDKEGAIMIGYVTSPNGDEEGNAGGLFFDEVLKETGDYKIVVKQNEAKSGATNIKFKVKVVLEKVYRSNKK